LTQNWQHSHINHAFYPWAEGQVLHRAQDNLHLGLMFAVLLKPFPVFDSIRLGALALNIA
jgi:hypothetical protein